MSQSVFSGQAVDPLLAELIEEITDKLQKGEPVDLEAHITKHPERAEELRKLLPALHMLAVAGSADSPPAADSEEAPLSGVLGDFRIIHQIGRGGMGVVYEAEQISLRRRVALKVLPFAAMMDPRQLQRFRNEAQAAACLHHNHIVPVYFVGCERGVHFYAMQLIEGQTLAALVHHLRDGVPARDKSQEASPAATTLPQAVLSTETPQQRAAYYRQVAQWGAQAAEALDYAHQMGVVHRDIKPGNLMVDGRGEVWITDFGLAQVQHGEGSLTLTGDLVGTLRYMSPEQALGKGVPVDHRTDVYSLGVTLYELLTLQPVFAGQDRQELLRQIAFEEPKALHRHNQSIPAELETIVLKALEKNPHDRYATAQEMSEDLQRWLECKPIHARRCGLRRQAGKWLRRHPGVTATAVTATVLALLLGLILQAVNNHLLQEQQNKTESALAAEGLAKDKALEAAQAESLAKRKAEAAALAEAYAKKLAQKRLGQIQKANGVLAAIFKDLDPHTEEKGGPPLRVQLGERLAAAALDADAVAEPKTLASLYNTLGVALVGLGEARRAVEFLTRSYTMQQALRGPDHIQTLSCMNDLAKAYLAAGRPDQGVALLERTLEKCQAKLGPDHPHTLGTMNDLGLGYAAVGKLNQAVPLLEQAVKNSKRILGTDDLRTFTTMGSLAWAYQEIGKANEAVPLLEEVLEKYKAKLGLDHPDTLESMHNMAVAYRNARRLDQALPLFEQTLEKRKAKLGAEHVATLLSMHSQAVSYWHLRKLDRSVPLFEKIVPLFKSRFGPTHPETLRAMANLGINYRDAGRLADAIPVLTEVCDKLRDGPEQEQKSSGWVLLELAKLYMRTGQFGKAEPLIQEGIARTRERWGADHPRTFWVMHELAEAYRAGGRLDKALPLHEKTLQTRRAKLGLDHPDTFISMHSLASAYEASGKIELAEALLQESVAQNRKRFGADHPQTGGVMALLGFHLLAQKKFASAEQVLRQSLDIRTKTQPDAWTTFNTQSLLGGALLGRKKYADAEPLLVAGALGLAKLRKSIPPHSKVRLDEAEGRLMELFEDTRKKDETKLQGKLTDTKTESTHEMKVTAGKPVVIEMQSRQFDTYLRLEDAKGKIVSENDDIDPASKNLNSRILFMPKADGAYRIVATSFEQRGRGEYEIVIREYGSARSK